MARDGTCAVNFVFNSLRRALKVLEVQGPLRNFKGTFNLGNLGQALGDLQFTFAESYSLRLDHSCCLTQRQWVIESANLSCGASDQQAIA